MEQHAIQSNAPPTHQLQQQTPAAQRGVAASEESSAQRLKTACSHCRQQKIKCRANDDLTMRCERCSKMKLTCTYEPRHSRGRPRSESEVVNDTPKRRLVAKANGEDGFRPLVAVNPRQATQQPGLSPPAVGGATREGQSSPQPALANVPLNPVAALAPLGIVSDPRIAAAGGTTNTTSARPEPKSNYTSPAQTLPRSIDGLQLNAEGIDNLFGQFFRYYHPLLPLLDPRLRPNEFYAQSSFLFWSILAVASRRWPKDSTLMAALRSRVLTHAMTSIFSPTTGTSTITAILLLLSWSFPETQTHDEMPYVFSSALVHAAMRIGMNTPDATQDYSRVKLAVSDVECRRRYQIYAHCLVLYQRYASPYIVAFDHTHHVAQVILLHG
jgi:hypothetical protein